jgi:hypothetical protein
MKHLEKVCGPDKFFRAYQPALSSWAKSNDSNEQAGGNCSEPLKKHLAQNAGDSLQLRRNHLGCYRLMGVGEKPWLGMVGGGCVVG